MHNRGEPGAAMASFREAVRLDPTDGAARIALATALRLNGDVSGAASEFRAALRLNENDELAHRNFAWMLATGPDSVRDGKEAVHHATRACELTQWKNPNALAILGAACAEAGDFDKAIEHQKKALTFQEYVKKYGADAQERLRLYERKQPYRASVPSAPAPRETKP
jgi:Flp pilus assembly protein TadD